MSQLPEVFGVGAGRALSERTELLVAAKAAAQEDHTYSAISALVAWAYAIEIELAKAAPVPSPGNLPELQALINRAEKAEARAQELTNKIKHLEALGAGLFAALRES